MLTSKHYIPILRWKEAEKGGLRQLRPEIKKAITPLIELIMPRPRGEITLLKQKTPAELLTESVALFKENLPKIPDEILKCWGEGAIFVDCHLIDSSVRAVAMEKILSRGEELNIFMIPVINIVPVVGLDSDLNTRKTAIDFAKKNKNGLCLRILRSDLNQELLPTQIKEFLHKNGLREQNVDLIIDLQVVGADDESQTISKLIDQKIPNLNNWRNFAIAGGAFPPDLTQFAQPNRYDIPRCDWTNWMNSRNLLKRKPSFSDYAIQCPIYKEPVLDANPSASIRYTLRDKWIVMKGRALRPSGLKKKKGPGFSQYPAQANLLSKQPEFFGENFSAGDAYIAEKGKNLKTKETGNPMTWLRAGINHHLTCTADQVSNLS